MLLTKRPESVRDKVPYAWHGGFPPNVWVGTSVEDQRRADERIPHLLRLPARVRFLSCEPLLGPVNLCSIPIDDHTRADVVGGAYIATGAVSGSQHTSAARIHWVIAGGESGPGSRPMHPTWIRSLRDQCLASGVPFFFKQWGQFAPPSEHSSGELTFEDGQRMRSIGKQAAGRLLDEREWNEMPA
jgi:protein gp37